MMYTNRHKIINKLEKEIKINLFLVLFMLFSTLILSKSNMKINIIVCWTISSVLGIMSRYFYIFLEKVYEMILRGISVERKAKLENKI